MDKPTQRPNNYNYMKDNKETIRARRKYKYAETKRHRLAIIEAHELAIIEAHELALYIISTLDARKKAILRERISREPEILAESMNEGLNNEILVDHIIIELIRLLN